MIPNRCAGQRLECAEEEEGDAVASATDDDKAVRPLDKQILEIFGCRSNKLVLLGHSFGGATVRLFSELLAHGDEAERAVGTDSPLFRGGMINRIHSIVTLAAPMNGTTAYDLFTDPCFDPKSVKIPWWSKGLARMMALGTKPKRDERDARDYANFDMHIDNAIAMNRRITTFPQVCYFSVPCCLTYKRKDGTHRPRKGMEPLFVMRACQIGAYAGKTAGGIELDESWRENDGLVNTVSAKAPTGAPAKPLDETNIVPGVWNVFPTVNGDHMWPQGGLMHKHDVRELYLKILRMIDQLQDLPAKGKVDSEQENEHEAGFS